MPRPPSGHAHIRVRVRLRVMIRVENLLSQQYLLNRDVLFSYLDRRSTTYFDLWPDADRLFTVCGLWPASGFYQQQQQQRRRRTLPASRTRMRIGLWVITSASPNLCCCGATGECYFKIWSASMVNASYDVMFRFLATLSLYRRDRLLLNKFCLVENQL